MDNSLDDLIKSNKEELNKFNSSNVFTRNKKLIIVILAVLFALYAFARLYLYFSMPKLKDIITTTQQNTGVERVEPERPVVSPEQGAESVKPDLADISSWRSYTDSKPGFLFKYPRNYFSNSSDLSKNIKSSEMSKLIFEISNNPKFDDDQFALVISGYESNIPPQDSAFRVADGSLITDLLGKRLNVQAIEEFTGNPPYGLYSVSIPLKNHRGSYLKISARIHYESAEEDLKVFNSLLSTFSFFKLMGIYF